MENYMDIIYKITSPSGKSYIGRTKDFSQRMIEHKSEAKRNSNRSIHKSINKYGWDNMKQEILMEVHPRESQDIEEFLIKKYDTVKIGYNETYVGGGGDQWKGRYDTPEYKQFVEKMKEINGGYQNGMYGKKHGQSTIVEMKKKSVGRFSLPWFQDKYGKTEGQVKYDDRCLMLKNRVIKKDKYGRFTK
jgi:group I intron endonuclease